MRNRVFLLVAFFAASTALFGQAFTTTTVIPTPSSPSVLVNYTGDLPADHSLLEKPETWHVWWRPSANAPRQPVTVEASEVHEADETIELKLSGTLPPPSMRTRSFWLVQFNPSDSIAYTPSVMSFTPTLGASTKSCGNSLAKDKSFLCPPSAHAPADLSLSGSFLVGGGTKPIYSFSAVGGLYSGSIGGWMPGVSTDVEINQGTSSSDRTTFDPDSITASFSLQRIVRTDALRKYHLFGLQLDESLPAGEFSRADQSSNIVVKSNAVFALTPWIPRTHDRYFATLYPMLGIETGRNLNKPGVIAHIPVDLSRYDAIFRGVAGANLFFSKSSKDKSKDMLTFTGLYRVRLPAFDEPMVESRHQLKTVLLTTRARHWAELDANYTFGAFQYLSLNAKYQYGDLPPLFNLVDHKFTIGFTLQAIQSRKGHMVAPTN